MRSTSTSRAGTSVPGSTVRQAGAAAVAVVAIAVAGTAASAGPPEARFVPASSHQPAAPEAQAEGDSRDPVALRSRLQALFGEHVVLTVELLRSRVDGQGQAGEAALAAVERNADGLAAEMGEAYGARTGERYGALWSVHVRQLSDYAIALAADDRDGQADAKHSLHETEQDIAVVIADATGGDPKALAAGVAQHHRTMLRQADAYAASDFQESYAAQRTGFAEAIATGHGLATGIALSRGQSPAPLEEPRRALQSALSRLLAEHMGLMGQAMKSAAAQAPDLEEAGRALNSNSEELGQAVGALYGEPTARRFLDVWGRHVEALMGFAAARGEGAGAEQARAELGSSATELSAFLSEATGLPGEELSPALTQHDEQLTSMLTARVAGDEVRAQEVAATGYQHMFDLSETLAVAIGNKVAARLPVGGAQTGGGGTAARR